MSRRLASDIPEVVQHVERLSGFIVARLANLLPVERSAMTGVTRKAGCILALYRRAEAMLVTSVRIKAPAGMRDEIAKTLGSVLGPTRVLPGCISCRLYQ